MAKLLDNNCENCTKKNNNCCKICIETHKSSVFAPLSSKELDFLIEGKQQIIYNPGETIIKQNTSTTTVICVKEGLAKIYVESNAGKNVIVNIASKGDFITGGGLFNGSVQHFSISALTSVQCCLIDSAKLTTIFSENSDFAVKLLRHHTKQNNFLLKKLVDHTQKYMPGRVADTLLYLKNEIFKTNTFNVPLTRHELAEMSNMTKESFVRILHQLKESQAIRTQGNTIEILNEDSLIKISKNG
ncbi:Crp/Fnr family transcriptional regulator [Prolixibacteraceae bacterium Z1-6]|uniref:Crp/Fnr family transcriptional regulator n=1 Tax=Draconibacterium aestuarii TaxID=2998507 RepID=A0A9X3J9A7_9BACT|nr:Crp/Fnr family transcriptional regulator [Prolixibacteraceae bacterium Z1-6]